MCVLPNGAPGKFITKVIDLEIRAKNQIKNKLNIKCQKKCSAAFFHGRFIVNRAAVLRLVGGGDHFNVGGLICPFLIQKLKDLLAPLT